MKITPKLTALCVAALTVSAGLSAPAMAATPLMISQEPLYVTNRVKPAFIMAVDDSGSMRFEMALPVVFESPLWNPNELATPTANGFFSAPGVLRNRGHGGGYPADLNGDGDTSDLYELGFDRNGNGNTNQAGERPRYLHLIPNGMRNGGNDVAVPPLDLFGFLRSPDFNAQWFDPGVTYTPWAEDDGSSLPNSPITAARSDPRPNGSAGVPGPNPVRTFNFTALRSTTTDDEEFGFFYGMVLPAGTEVNVDQDCGGLGTTAATRNVWITLAADHTVTQAGGGFCEYNIRYFPAVVYRTVDKPAPTGFDETKRVTVANAGGNGVSLHKYELRAENFLNVDDYNKTIQNFANWYTYYGNRTRATIAGMTRALDNVYFMRAGYFRINDTNPTVTMRDLAEGSTTRRDFYDQIITLPAGGGTPNRSATGRMIDQFNRTDANAPVQVACQINAGMLFTDGFTNESGGPNVGNVDGDDGAPFADTHSNTLADIARRGYENRLRSGDMPAGLVQVREECDGGNPSPTLNCNRNLHMNFHGVVLSLEGDEWKRPTPPALPRDAFATPYPVWTATGTTNQQPSNIDDIWHAAVNSYGTFTSARNPLDVTRAMQDVVNSVLDATEPVGTPPVAGPRVGADSATYSTGFNVRNNGRDWIGNVEAFRINADGSTGARLWSAESMLPAANARKILATRTPGPRDTRSVVPFQAANFGSTEAARASAIGVTSTAFSATFTAGYTMANAYDYLRGDQALERVNDSVNPLGFRSRSGRIGSIINSPAEVETRNTFYTAFDSLPDPEGAAYRAYRATKRSTFTPTVFVGGNAGKMHAFHADTGVELFAFVPNGALREMGQLLYQNYQHRYYVDGELNATDAVVDGTWRTVLLGNMGRGGRSVFALDVSNTASFGETNVLWEMPTTDPDLGQAAGRVEVMLAEDNNWYAVFANGVNSDNQNAGLFVVNLSSGIVERKIMADDGGDFANGLMRIALADTDGNGKVDAVYGGDYVGNLWKFNLSGASSAWGVAFSGEPLFEARDSGGNPQPITGGIAVSRGPSDGVMVHFGTGSYLTDTDAVFGSPQQLQTFYGVWDRPGSGSGNLTRASLRQQTITGEFGSGDSIGRTLSNNRVDFSTQNGWFLDLQVAGAPQPTGERFIGEPRIIGDSITIPTSEPAGTGVCTPGLRSWGYRLDRLSGGPVLNRMERPGGDVVCATANCGGLLTRASGAPVTGSSVVQPQRPCRRGIDPECPAIADPAAVATACGSPNPDDATFNVDYEACACAIAGTCGPPTDLVCSISNPIGNQDFGGEPQVCGRQSWRQVR